MTTKPSDDSCYMTRQMQIQKPWHFPNQQFFKCHDQNQNSTNLKIETSVIFLKYQLIHIQCCNTSNF